MSLREAARRSSRSVTTLRRYIRRGKLQADKHAGRYGPEYRVTDRALSDAGLPAVADPPASALAVTGAARLQEAAEPVPLALYQELQSKHEQLLVQHGMLRVAGLRALEFKAELDGTRRRLEEAQSHVAELRRKLADENSRLSRRLRRSELERESRQIELEALREKLRSLEMLHRNAETSDSIERQFAAIMEQSRRVRDSRREPPAPHGPRQRDTHDH